MTVTLTKAPHGFTMVMSGSIVAAEMDAMVAQARTMLPASGPFGLITDQREAKLIPPDVQAQQDDIIKLFVSRGLARVAMLCPTAVATMQALRIVEGTPIEGIFYAVNGKDPKCWQIATDWVVKGERTGDPALKR
jgi:hypothetical protein